MGKPQHHRAIWLSDIHLGTRGCKAEYLLDFLRANESDYLYLVGDIIDGWQLKRSWYWDQYHNDVIQKLLRKVRKGTVVVYIPGNHDEFAREYVNSVFGGITVRSQATHAMLDGRKLLVLHGDEFDGIIRYARWLAVLNGYGVRVPTAVIPTGLEPAEFMDGSRQRFCEAYGIDTQRPVLVHIGRIAHEKNIGFLLEVLCLVREQVPDVLLVIAGEGPARSALQQRAARLGLQANTLFIGYLPRGPALWDCYCAGDVFVFASATETQGQVLLEAMALGVPLVSTAVMGTRDILEAGKGALVAEETTQDFAAKVIRLLKDPSLREQLGREARDYMHEWSAQNQARRLAELYLEVIAEYNRG